MFATRARKRLARYLAGACVLALVVTAGLWWVFRGIGDRTITAYFPEAVGIFGGSEVMVLGVEVGTIESVHPDGKRVKVTMSVERDVPVPANAKAIIVEPSVVAGRYIQLSPVYAGGPRMSDDAVIPASRTASPVEVDQLYSSLKKLTDALGPKGANKHGALSDLLNTGAANLDSNGNALGNVISQLGKATRTLSGSKRDLFSTVDNLQAFTTMLRNNDSSVRKAEQQLADVSGFLADDRDDLGAALHTLAGALDKVQGFIDRNREHITSNVSKLRSITKVMVENRSSLAEALDDVPLALDNLLNAFDPRYSTLDARGDLNWISRLYGGSGSAAGAAGNGGKVAACAVTAGSCGQAGPGDMEAVPEGSRDGLPPLPLSPSGPVYGSQGGGE